MENTEGVFKETKREVSGRDVWTPERQERAEEIYRERHGVLIIFWKRFPVNANRLIVP